MLAGHKLVWPRVTTQQPLLLAWHHRLRPVTAKCWWDCWVRDRTGKRSTQKQRKSERDKGKVRRLREGSLICFLGRMTKLCGMQWRGERELIASPRTKRGENIVDRLVERGRADQAKMPGPSIDSLPLPHPINILSIPSSTIQLLAKRLLVLSVLKIIPIHWHKTLVHTEVGNNVYTTQ